MRWFSRSEDFSDLESELRDGRPEPRPELVHELVARVERQSVRARRRPRLAVAVVFATTIVVALAAFGGIGYAKSSIVSAAKSSQAVVSSAVKTGGDGKLESNRNQGQNGDKSGSGNKNGSSGSSNGSGQSSYGGGGNHHDPPWVHQYSRFVLVCYPFEIRVHRRTVTIYRTLVVPSLTVRFFVPPGTVGACP